MSFNIILMLNKKSETALKGKYYIEAMSRELNEHEKSGLDEELACVDTFQDNRIVWELCEGVRCVLRQIAFRNYHSH